MPSRAATLRIIASSEAMVSGSKRSALRSRTLSEMIDQVDLVADQVRACEQQVARFVARDLEFALEHRQQLALLVEVIAPSALATPSSSTAATSIGRSSL